MPVILTIPRMQRRLRWLVVPGAGHGGKIVRVKRPRAALQDGGWDGRCHLSRRGSWFQGFQDLTSRNPSRNGRGGKLSHACHLRGTHNLERYFGLGRGMSDGNGIRRSSLFHNGCVSCHKTSWHCIGLRLGGVWLALKLLRAVKVQWPTVALALGDTMDTMTTIYVDPRTFWAEQNLHRRPFLGGRWRCHVRRRCIRIGAQVGRATGHGPFE